MQNYRGGSLAIDFDVPASVPLSFAAALRTRTQSGGSADFTLQIDERLVEPAADGDPDPC